MNLSTIYRLMCYFVHATIDMYKEDCISTETTTVSEFRKLNETLIKRVFDEGLSIMNYELSHEQMNRGIMSYLISKYKPQSIFSTQAYERPNIL